MIELTIFFDLETLPTADEALIVDIASSILPPARMTKAETISRWEIEEKPQAVLDAISKTSLDGGLGRCAAIGMAVGDGEILWDVAIDADGQPSEDAERWLIEGFLAACEAVHQEYRSPPIMAGHNIGGFDLRWLWKRAIVLGIRMPHWWPHNARAWDQDRFVDTMTMWEGPRGYIGLDRLARRLGIRGKSDLDGSMVAAAWAAGEYQRVGEYCGDDVRVVREVFHRLDGTTSGRPRKIKAIVEKDEARLEAPSVDGEREPLEVCF